MSVTVAVITTFNVVVVKLGAIKLHVFLFIEVGLIVNVSLQVPVVLIGVPSLLFFTVIE